MYRLGYNKQPYLQGKINTQVRADRHGDGWRHWEPQCHFMLSSSSFISTQTCWLGKTLICEAVNWKVSVSLDTSSSIKIPDSCHTPFHQWFLRSKLLKKNLPFNCFLTLFGIPQYSLPISPTSTTETLSYLLLPWILHLFFTLCLFNDSQLHYSYKNLIH